MNQHKVAEDIFRKNIGVKIRAIIFSGGKDFMTFEGVLDNINCNQFFIINEDKSIDMFRYEDLINLKVIK